MCVARVCRYDPANTANVEWSSWDRRDAVKLGWRNWGSQIRVAPHPNLASPKVIEATRQQLRSFAPVIARW
jgi:hypothetical protein